MYSRDNNRFRQKRGLFLAQLLKDTCLQLGQKLSILDVGGRPAYWNNITLSHVKHIQFLNYNESEFQRYALVPHEGVTFSYRVGDACDLSNFDDKSVDFVHSNSVIEHVGDWPRMVAMAHELRRVGRAGWVQTPAWEFPIEPHFRLPFMHWLARPMQAWLVYYSPPWRGKRNDLDIRRRRVERINLVSKKEFHTLFPNAKLYVERIILPKSYAAYWRSPEDGAD